LDHRAAAGAAWEAGRQLWGAVIAVACGLVVKHVKVPDKMVARSSCEVQCVVGACDVGDLAWGVGAPDLGASY